MTEQKTVSDLGLDERKVAKQVAVWLPVGTIVAALLVGTILGPALAILTLGAGGLLGVVAILWASIRVLTGDAVLPPEFEGLEQGREDVDALATQRKMMLLALKDLQNEHAVGKLDDEDFEHISQTYRANLKVVLKEIDAQLAPFREKAEKAAAEHVGKVATVDEKPVKKADPKPEPTRLVCPKCEESNEPDAKFCKGCGAGLGAVNEA